MATPSMQQHWLIAVAGKAGADDYIRKTIDPPWAVNRVQAVLRRAES